MEHTQSGIYFYDALIETPTFLFTDIDAYAQVLMDRHEIVRAEHLRHCGRESANYRARHFFCSSVELVRCVSDGATS